MDKSRTMTLTDFCNIHERESWKGLSTAFRNGVKCAVTGDECNYCTREDFGAAWMRGNSIAEKFINDGGTIVTGVKEMMLKIKQQKRRIEELEQELKSEREKTK